MPIEWWRGLDDEARFHVFAVEGQSLKHYFPDVDGTIFRYRSTIANGTVQTGTADFNRPVRDVCDTYSIDAFEQIAGHYGIVHRERAELTPGQYYPRIWRQGDVLHPRAVGLLSQWTDTVTVARGLFERLRGLLRYVHPRKEHDEVFSLESRELLVLACTEVESAWKAILTAHAYRGDAERWNTSDYVKLLPALRLDSWTVALSVHPEYGEICPFEGWDPAKPSQTLGWYSAYHGVKHNREGELHRATLRHTIDAMAAVYVMGVAQFGPLHLESDRYFNADGFRGIRYPRFEIGKQYTRPLPPALGWSAVTHAF